MQPLLHLGPNVITDRTLITIGFNWCYYGWDFYYAWVQMLLQMGPLLHSGPVITLVPLKRLSHSGHFLLSFFFYTMLDKIQPPLWVVVVYDLLVWRSVLKMFARFIFRMAQRIRPRKMFNSKWLLFTINMETVISGNLKNALKTN